MNLRPQSLLFLISSSFFLILMSARSAHAQEKDSMKVVNLNEIKVQPHAPNGGIERMPDIHDHAIYAGKKSEVVLMEKVNADLSTNNTRQVFAKVPGLSVWENDGSGIQVGVATRGLSPNRSWEFNVRQNGHDICSEIFGYPESYYSPPMEAIEKIEVVRGSASLQYGPQFGGLLNYEIKKGNPDKEVSVESYQTAGSYGLFNTYNSIGGTSNNFSYFGFFHHRSADGWRENSAYNIYTGYFSAEYKFSEKLNVGVDYTRMSYKSQQAGGLTDMQFREDHRQSFRERNWFSTPWNVASLNIEYKFSPKLRIQVKAFTTIAERNSVGYTKAITLADSLNPLTSEYSPRQVDMDSYRNYGAELRLVKRYLISGRENTLAAGVRIYKGNTDRKQLGTGTTGKDFDLSLTGTGNFGRSLEFSTDNAAVFAENIFLVGTRLKLIPGLRLDYIMNSMEGYINTSLTGSLVPDERKRLLILYGLGSEFAVSSSTELYANYSLAYRPVTFSELTPSATSEVIDPNLKDASGYNVDFGYRGILGEYFNFDIGVFYLLYENRIGSITQNGNLFRTNIGTSESKGIESYVEFNPVKMISPECRFGNISLFASNAFIEAKYIKWNNPSISSDPVKSIENKDVENAPRYIHRFGFNYNLKGLTISAQVSNVSSVYTDAANTETPNASGTTGKIDSYQVMDASAAFTFLKHYHIKAGVNNIQNEKYATRRAGGYPGPGLLPGNGRTFFLTAGIRF
ncbi:MAG: TonB-dependent receptor [Bacteroidetes bacterium]|nr:MAG: TonB-dependent receptor [Bacteroidota bacterium]REK04827.1 MAG: TonB-dependent receptor [Bacteroidota bacterium]REK36299.1 MAG: TonB-dependent receptor [Bacteroidota bacterium]REK51035.1 MAG: TonB-dependent receptor [Bacteroidota bacterium]